MLSIASIGLAEKFAGTDTYTNVGNKCVYHIVTLCLKNKKYLGSKSWWHLQLSIRNIEWDFSTSGRSWFGYWIWRRTMVRTRRYRRSIFVHSRCQWLQTGRITFTQRSSPTVVYCSSAWVPEKASMGRTKVLLTRMRIWINVYCVFWGVFKYSNSFIFVKGIMEFVKICKFWSLF